MFKLPNIHTDILFHSLGNLTEAVVAAASTGVSFPGIDKGENWKLSIRYFLKDTPTKEQCEGLVFELEARGFRIINRDSDIDFVVTDDCVTITFMGKYVIVHESDELCEDCGGLGTINRGSGDDITIVPCECQL